jgi:peptide-methionine (R)-S-oxide reductase
MILLWIFLLALSPSPLTQESLDTERYKVMREKGSERAFSGKYLYETARGAYLCAACKNPLFHSDDKYDSGSGWPSFRKAIKSESIYYLEDRSLPFKRYEILCRGCDSHLGHVFNDGPPPKGLRYCVNSITLFLENQL